MLIFRQIYDDDLAQAAYLVGDATSKTAVIVDPLRDVDVTLDLLADHGLTLVGVVETHIHADFLSGGRELARAADVPLYISSHTVDGWHYSGLDGLEVVALAQGEMISLDNVELTALHTPGHTPEHLSFLVRDREMSSQPSIVLTGDFVFADDLGRPDLLEVAAGEMDTAEPGARELFDAVGERFLDLPDFVQVWPGHGAGSACGKSLGDVPATTVGYERRNAWWSPYLERGDKSAFVHELLRDQPASPTYFRRMKILNRDGAPYLQGLPALARLTPARLTELVDDGAMILDLRDVHAFARGHLPGSINLSSRRKLSTYAGWAVPDDRPLVLACPSADLEEATRKLLRIGLDDLAGFIPTERWRQYLTGQPARYPVITAPRAVHRLWTDEEIHIIDARSHAEFAAGHIPGALHVHYGQVPEYLDDVPQDRTLAVHCEAGPRAALAASQLAALGDRDVLLYTGGFGGWRDAGFPVTLAD